MLEEGVVPTLLGPFVRLSPVFYGTPVGQAHGAVAVHAVEGGLQLVGHSLTLVENHVGLVLEILGIAVPLVVETGDFRDTGQFGWSHVGLELLLLAYGPCASGEHGHGGGTRRVVSLHHLVKDAIGGDAPVVGWVSAPSVANLQLVAQTPEDDARAVAVALDPFPDEFGPDVHEGLSSAPVFVVAPLVDELVHDEQALLVGNARKRGGIGVVGASQVVEAKLLHHPELSAYGIVVGGSAQGAHVVVVGHAFEEEFPAIQFEAELGAILNAAHPEAVRLPVGQQSVNHDLHLHVVEIRIVDVPQCGLLYGDVGQSEFVLPMFGERVHRGLRRTYRVPQAVPDGGAHHGLWLLAAAVGESLHLYGDGYIGLPALQRGTDIDAVPTDVGGILQSQPHVAEQPRTRVPAAAVWLARVGIDRHHVVLSVAQMFRDFCLKAQIAIFRRGHPLPVDIDVAVVHHSLEVEHHAQSLPFLGGTEVLTIPALALSLPASCATGPFVPGLFPLEVVRQVQPPPLAVVRPQGLRPLGVAQLEVPVEVEQQPSPVPRHRGGMSYLRLFQHGDFGIRAIRPCGLRLHIDILGKGGIEEVRK